MNIFATDRCPVKSAQALDDRRMNKMILETAQILSTALDNMSSWRSFLYKPTHSRHPCVLWASYSKGNFNWLVQHGLALCDEYTYRFGRTHKSKAVILAAQKHIKTVPLDRSEFIPQPNCTVHKGLKPVWNAYKFYLAVDKWPRDINPRWTRRGAPDWRPEFSSLPKKAA